jgi:hypothetical protein
MKQKKHSDLRYLAKVTFSTEKGVLINVKWNKEWKVLKRLNPCKITMNALTICVLVLGVAFAPVSSFVVSSPTSCEYYDASCVEKTMASNGAQDVSQVHFHCESYKYYL